MCRNCGAIVGAGQTQCGVCGASTAPQAPTHSGSHPPDRETIRFARAVLSRPYKFTIIFLIANLFVFLLMWESSGMALSVLQRGFSEAVLITYGAKLNYLINSPNNQWWRFITPMFVHIDVLHIVMNMFSLLIIGPFVEKLYGSAKFVVLYVVTGIAGVVGSYFALQPALARGALGTFIFKAVDAPSAGASGALFGLVGVLFVFGIKYRHELPEGFRRVFGTGLLPIIFINLFIGFVGRSSISNAAHLGGLFSGAALALFIDYRRPGARAGITIAWRALQIVCLVLIAVGAIEVVRNYGRQIPSLARASQDANKLVFANYANTMTAVQEKLEAVIHNNDLSNVKEVTQKAREAPVPDARAAELRERLLEILDKATAAAAMASPPPANQPQQPPKLDQKLIDERDQWKKEYNDWLKGPAKVYQTAPA